MRAIKSYVGTLVLCSGFVSAGCSAVASEEQPSEETSFEEGEHVESVGHGVDIGGSISFIGKAYETLVSGWKVIIGADDPADPAFVAAAEIALRIEAAKTEVLNAMELYHSLDAEGDLVDYEAGVRQVTSQFHEFLTLPAGSGDGPDLRRTLHTLAVGYLEHYNTYVARTQDAVARGDAIEKQVEMVERLYQLAPAYNMLLATYVLIAKAHEDIYPGVALDRGASFEHYMRAGLNANYALIGTSYEACGGTTYPPTRDRMYVGQPWYGTPGLLHEPTVTEVYENSLLFTKKFGNRHHDVPYQTYHDVTYCNLTQNQCMIPDFYTSGGVYLPCDGADLNDTLKFRFDQCLHNAKNTVIKDAFFGDPTVQLIIEAQKALMGFGFVTIATTGGGFPGPDPSVGAYFDPWVRDEPCGENGRGRYYPVYFD